MSDERKQSDQSNESNNQDIFGTRGRREENKHQTSYLGQSDARPMQDRPARPQTAIIGPGAVLEVAVSGKKVQLGVKEYMLIGRLIEGDDPENYALDLGPLGGYQSGVSRQHAAITMHDGGLYIEDLGSTNGTRINGFQLTARRKYRLRDGDEVEFARLRTVFHFQK